MGMHTNCCDFLFMDKVCGMGSMLSGAYARYEKLTAKHLDAQLARIVSFRVCASVGFVCACVCVCV